MLGPVLKIISLHWFAPMQNFAPRCCWGWWWGLWRGGTLLRSFGWDKGLCPHDSAQQASGWFMTDRSAGGGHWCYKRTHKLTRWRCFQCEDAHQACDCSKQPMIWKYIEMLSYTHTHTHAYTHPHTPLRAVNLLMCDL